MGRTWGIGLGKGKGMGQGQGKGQGRGLDWGDLGLGLGWSWTGEQARTGAFWKRSGETDNTMRSFGGGAAAPARQRSRPPSSEMGCCMRSGCVCSSRRCSYIHYSTYLNYARSLQAYTTMAGLDG